MSFRSFAFFLMVACLLCGSIAKRCIFLAAAIVHFYQRSRVDLIFDCVDGELVKFQSCAEFLVKPSVAPRTNINGLTLG